MHYQASYKKLGQCSKGTRFNKPTWYTHTCSMYICMASWYL